MRRFKWVLPSMALAVFLCLPSAAPASVASNLRVGVQNVLQDDNFESVFGLVNGVLDVGSRAIGVFFVESLQAPGFSYTPGDANGTITALFMLEVLGKQTGGVGPGNQDTEIYFGPLQNGVGNAASTEWSNELVNRFGFSAAEAALISPTNDGTMAILFNQTPLGELVPSTQQANTGDSIRAFTGLSGDTSGTKWWEFGFTGEAETKPTGVIHGPADEFWVTQGIAGIDDPVGGAILDGATNRLGINLLERHGGPPLVMFVSTLGVLDNTVTPFGTGHSLQGNGNFEPPEADMLAWQLRTNTNLYVYPIPEPSSLAIFAGLSLLGLAASTLRRRREAKSA
jgi:MYXO-CTERM domain-containing protein